MYKWQTRPPSERVPHEKQDRNCETVINIWSWAPYGAWHQDWLADRQSQCNFDFDFDFEWVSESVSRVKARSNTSIVALWVVGGDEKETQRLGL
jgi:hypothetical protein